MKQDYCNLQEFENFLKTPLPKYIANSIKIFCEIDNSTYNKELKQEYLKKLIDRIIWLHEVNCAVELLYHIINNAEEYSSDHKDKLISCTRKILNNPAVVESYQNTSSKHIHQAYMTKIAGDIETLFTAETALAILRNNPDKNIFILFGYHPETAKHIDLQTKWIKYYSEYKIIDPLFGIRYITDEALLSNSPDTAFNFIKKFFFPWYKKEIINYMKHFTLETIKKITFMHIVANGIDNDTRYILKGIKEVEKLQQQ